MLWQVEIKGLQEIYQVISNFVSSNLKVSIVQSILFFSSIVFCNLNTWELAFKCYLRIIARSIKVWIVGSSIVKDAFIEARRTPGGIDLGL